MFTFGTLEHVSNMAQVRGTPASGKTTLAKLLHSYILLREPEAIVTRVPSWRRQETLMNKGGWRQWLVNVWNAQDGSVLIVDEAQTSYWDDDFWGMVKDIDQDSKFRIITFASYGSTGVDTSRMTPHSPYRNQIVGLHPTDYGDGIAVGLLLTKAEFLDFVTKKFSGHRFDKAFLDSIYDLTAGHVGACKDVLNIIQAHDVSPYTQNTHLRNYNLTYATVISLAQK